jgi:hypothetical protein
MEIDGVALWRHARCDPLSGMKVVGENGEVHVGRNSRAVRWI